MDSEGIISYRVAIHFTLERSAWDFCGKISSCAPTDRQFRYLHHSICHSCQKYRHCNWLQKSNASFRLLVKYLP